MVLQDRTDDLWIAAITAIHCSTTELLLLFFFVFVTGILWVKFGIVFYDGCARLPVSLSERLAQLFIGLDMIEGCLGRDTPWHSRRIEMLLC